MKGIKITGPDEDGLMRIHFRAEGKYAVLLQRADTIVGQTIQAVRDEAALQTAKEGA